jgi:hypothetical protein
MDLVPLSLLALGVIVFALGLVGVGRQMKRAGTADVTLREDADTVKHGVLAERKEMLMTLIASTELDLATGKITEDVCERTLRGLKREAVTVIKQMEALGGDETDLEFAEAALVDAERVAPSANGDGTHTSSLAAGTPS